MVLVCFRIFGVTNLLYNKLALVARTSWLSIRFHAVATTQQNHKKDMATNTRDSADDKSKRLRQSMQAG
jgi:hypothetical protein